MTQTPKFILSADGQTVDDVLLRAPEQFVANGVRHPRDIFTKWTDAGLAGIGVYRVNPDSVPPGETETSRSYSRNGDRFDETIASAPLSDAEIAAGLEIRARSFWDTLRPALALKGHSVGPSPVKTWLEQWVIAHGSLTDGQKEGALDALQAQYFWRGDAYVATLGALLGFSSSEIDALFIDASAA